MSAASHLQVRGPGVPEKRFTVLSLFSGGMGLEYLFSGRLDLPYYVKTYRLAIHVNLGRPGQKRTAPGRGGRRPFPSTSLTRPAEGLR